MIQDYLELYPQALWVQIAQQQMSLLSPSQTLLAQEMCPISFDSLDSFAVNYPVAEHHFAQLLQQANLKWNEFGQPIVFIQLMDRTESQLDGIEIQAIREIALSANARMVQIFFKNAFFGCRREYLYRLRLFAVFKNQHFARIYVSYKLCPNEVKCTCLRCNNPTFS